MKKAVLFFFLFLSFSFAGKAIQWEARTGLSISGNWGLHTSAYMGIPVSSLFALRPAVILHTVEGNSYQAADKWHIGVLVPVFASFRIPVHEKMNLRLDAGPYVGTGKQPHYGGAAEAGMEVGRIYVGAGYFQKFGNGSHSQLNLSVGYKFTF